MLLSVADRDEGRRVILVLQSQDEVVTLAYPRDLSSGYAGVCLRNLLAVKYKYDPKELSSQWLLPFQTMMRASDTREH